MLTAQDNRNENRKPARFAASILFVLVVGLGYSIAPRVEGAVGLPDAIEDPVTAEPYLQSECVADGLALSDCLLDF